MNKEQQDLAWACLPKEARDEIRKRYKNWVECLSFETEIILYDDLFGSHNLTSDTEPKELLYCRRDVVQSIFIENRKNRDMFMSQRDIHHELIGQNNVLYTLFGDKCLPDTTVAENATVTSVQVEPKFKKDEVVKSKSTNKVLKIYADCAEIEKSSCLCVCQDGSVMSFPINDLEPYVEPRFLKGDMVVSKLDGNLICIVESQSPITKLYQLYTGGSAVIHRAEQDLEPYTEPSQNLAENCDNGNLNSKTDNMEENPSKSTPLDLCELLKGCEGEEFFSISVGKVMFKAIYDYDDTHKVRTIRKDAVGNEYNVNFHSDGRRNKSGLPDLYPSEDLLKKYPLDANKAWDEWASERKSKYKLRVKVSLYENEEWREDKSSEMWMSLNSPSDALQATEVVRDALEKFNEKNCKQ